MAGEIPGLTGESIGEAHRVLECTQIDSPGNQHLKGHNPLWEVREVMESGTGAEQAALFPLRPLFHIQHHNAEKWVTPPW